MRRVVDNFLKHQTILQQLHDESGHNRQEDIYRQIGNRYWWENLYSEIKVYVQSCQKYQCQDPLQPEKALYLTWVTLLWQKIGLDVVYIPLCQCFWYLIVVCYDLSGWVKAKLLCTFFS